MRGKCNVMTEIREILKNKTYSWKISRIDVFVMLTKAELRIIARVN